MLDERTQLGHQRANELVTKLARVDGRRLRRGSRGSRGRALPQARVHCVAIAALRAAKHRLGRRAIARAAERSTGRLFGRVARRGRRRSGRLHARRIRGHGISMNGRRRHSIIGASRAAPERRRSALDGACTRARAIAAHSRLQGRQRSLLPGEHDAAPQLALVRCVRTQRQLIPGGAVLVASRLAEIVDEGEDVTGRSIGAAVGLRQ